MLMLTTLPTRCGGEITVGLLLSALPVGALFLHYSLYSILSNVVLFFLGGGVRVSPFIDLLNVCGYCCIQIKKFIYFLLTMRTLSWHLLRCSSLKYMGGKKTLIFILPPWNSNDPVWLLWCSTVSILLDLLGQIDGFIFLYITVCCRGNNNARLCGAAAWNAYDNGKTHDTINTFTTSPRTVTYTYIVTVIF